MRQRPRRLSAGCACGRSARAPRRRLDLYRKDGGSCFVVATEPELVGTAHPPVVFAAVAECERVAKHEPEDRHPARDGKGLHHGGKCVVGARHSRIEQRKAGDGHHEDQARGGEDPCGVASVDTREGHAVPLRRRKGRLGLERCDLGCLGGEICFQRGQLLVHGQRHRRRDVQPCVA